MNDDYSHLAADAADSPSAPTGNVQNNQFDREPDLSMDALVASVRAQGDDVPEGWEEVGLNHAPEQQVKADNSDESNIEAEQIEQEEVIDQEQLALEVVSYDSLLDQNVALEIGGKSYSPAQLKSILGQEVAAGTKAREASDNLKTVQEREQRLEEAEELLTNKVNAAKNVDKLATLSVDYDKMAVQLDAARNSGDAYEITILTDKMGMIAQEYAAAEDQVEQVRQAQTAQQVATAKEGLKARGLGYLDQDNDRSRAWVKYAKTHLSSTEFNSATLSPAYAEMVEKARRFDMASGKQGQKLTSQGPTLRGGSATRPSQSQNNQKLAQQVKEGTANPADIEAYLMAQGNEMFKS